MINFNDIKILQLEISNYCNAACPQCPRNFFGGRTLSNLPLHKLTFAEFKKLFSSELLTSLQQVYFCGTYGDPLTHPDIVNMCGYIKDLNPNINVTLHTNGGVGKISTFTKLASIVDCIAFGIDGLEDTNHLYRRNVRWHRVVENTKAFIEAGGNAEWDFIVFAHNQHQVNDARELSKKLKFNRFNVKKTSRFLNRVHKFQDHLEVYNTQNIIDYTIRIPTDPQYINIGYKEIHKINTDYIQNTKINCNACNIGEIYIGADGYVFPCGWLADRLYGPEVEGTADHSNIKSLIAQSGGLKGANIFFNSLENIVNGPWFKNIEKTWYGKDRLERCSIMCGEGFSIIGDQNTEIFYKT